MSYLFVHVKFKTNTSFCSESLGNRTVEGFRYGRIGLQIYKQFGVKQWIGRVYAAYYGCIHAMMLPHKESLAPLQSAYITAIESGDVENAFLLGGICSWIQLQTCTLQVLNADLQSRIKHMKMLGQTNNLSFIKGMAASVKIYLSDDGCINDKDFDNSKTENKDAIAYSHLHRMIVSYIFGNYPKAYIHSIACMKSVLVGPFATTELPFTVFMAAMTCIANPCQLKIRKVHFAGKCLKKLKNRAKYSPVNELSHVFLIEAELSAFRGKNIKALSKYTCAVAVAKDAGYLMETAIALERTAKFLLNTNQHTRSKQYFKEALSAYQHWGSVSKVKHLLNEIRDIFGSDFEKTLRHSKAEAPN